MFLAWRRWAWWNSHRIFSAWQTMVDRDPMNQVLTSECMWLW